MAEQEHEPVGSLGEEAVKLFGALGDWARDQGPDLGAGVAAAAGQASDAAARAAREVDEHLASSGSGATECTWCPVCRTVHALRQTSPEVRDQLVVAATALLQAGTGLLASLQAGRGQTQARTQGQHRADRGDGVERIDLSDEPDDDDEWES